MKRNIPPGQQFIKQFPVRTVEAEPTNIDPETWVLKITGLVAKPASFSFKEIQSMGAIEVNSDFHCVETWSVPDNVWKGVRVRDLLEKVSIKPEARYAMIRSWGGYDSDVDLEALMADEAILAWDRNGKPIEPEHGFPLRLIIPSRYAYKSVKWVVEIELMEKDRPGYWEKRGYHKRADVWAQERFDKK